MTIQRIQGEFLEEGHKAYMVTFSKDMSSFNYRLFHALVDRLVKYGHIGLDTEWKPIFGKGIPRQSLIQLTGFDISLIIQINQAKRLGWKLCEIFADKTIKKYGCEIEGDAELLVERFNIEINGLVDLEKLADKRAIQKKICGYKITGEPRHGKRGLVWLYNAVFQKQVPKKDKKITMSNWSRKTLSPQQIEYAIQDSVMSFRIGYHLHFKGS